LTNVQEISSFVYLGHWRKFQTKDRGLVNSTGLFFSFCASSSPLRHLRHDSSLFCLVSTLCSRHSINYPTGHFFYIVHLLCAVIFAQSPSASRKELMSGKFQLLDMDARSPFWFLTVGRLLGFSPAISRHHAPPPLPLVFRW
jgi:hypothetical protein